MGNIYLLWLNSLLVISFLFPHDEIIFQSTWSINHKLKMTMNNCLLLWKILYYTMGKCSQKSQLKETKWRCISHCTTVVNWRTWSSWCKTKRIDEVTRHRQNSTRIGLSFYFFSLKYRFFILLGPVNGGHMGENECCFNWNNLFLFVH